jgi:hypothetical protein
MCQSNPDKKTSGVKQIKKIPKFLQMTKKERVDLILVVIMAGFVWVGAGYLLGYNDPAYTYTFNLNAIDRTNHTIFYESGVAMTAKGFAAHIPIKVNVAVRAYNNDTGIVLGPESQVTADRNLTNIYVAFPRSHMLPLTPTGDLPNVYYGASINATWNPSDHLYHGDVEMVYEMQALMFWAFKASLMTSFKTKRTWMIIP